MSSQSLSQVANDIVDRYQQGAKHLVNAYQAGIERAARSSDDRFAAVVQKSTSPLADEAFKASVLDAQRRGSEIIVSGLRSGSAAIDAANERIASRVKAGIERVAAAVQRIDAAFNTKTVEALNVFGMPSARLQLSVANALAKGAQRIEAGAKGEASAEVAEPTVAPKKTTRRR